MTTRDQVRPIGTGSLTRLACRAAILGGAVAWAGLAAAQADRTGTGGGPLTTLTAPNTTATGTTMPPSSAAAPSERGIERRTPNERAMDRIDSSICEGCTPK